MNVDGEAELNKDGSKVHNKPEDVAVMEKEKAEHLDVANFKIVQDGVISKGGKDTGKIMEDKAELNKDIFKVHKKAEGVAAKEKKKAEHLDEANFKIGEDGVISKGGKATGKNGEGEAEERAGQ